MYKHTTIFLHIHIYTLNKRYVSDYTSTKTKKSNGAYSSKLTLQPCVSDIRLRASSHLSEISVENTSLNHCKRIAVCSINNIQENYILWKRQKERVLTSVYFPNRSDPKALELSYDDKFGKQGIDYKKVCKNKRENMSEPARVL